MFEKLKQSIAVLLAATMVAGMAGTSVTTVLAGENYDSDYIEQSEESSYVEEDGEEIMLSDLSSPDEPGEITQEDIEAYIDSDQGIDNGVSGDMDTSITQDTTSQEEPATQSAETPQDVTTSVEDTTAQEDTTSQDDTSSQDVTTSAEEPTNQEDTTTAEETTTEEEATAFDQYESIDIDDNNKLYIHITAPEGVLPAGSYFTVKKIDRTADTEAYVSAKRAVNAFVFESYVLDMTMYNKDGEKIQPDTENGQVSIVMGINSMSAEPQKAANAVKKEIAAGALSELTAIYQDTEFELSAEDISSVIDEVLEETDISYSADVISLDIYHIPDNATYADFLYTERIYSDSAISYAERLVQTYTDSFSEYPVELSVSCDINELTQGIVTAASELIDEALATAGDNNIELAKETYNIEGELEFKTDEMSISDIISELETKQMLPSTFHEPVKQVVSGSSQNPAITINEKSPLPNYDASVTVGRGGQRGTISIYDAQGDEYILTVYNSLPTVSEYYDKLEFDVIWNDNSGSTALDKTNLVDRPDGTSGDYKYVKDNYVLQFKVDSDGEWQDLTADNYTQAGLTEFMDITGTDDKAVNASGGIWTFIYDDVNKLPHKYLEDGKEHTVEFRILQKAVVTGYDAATTDAGTETIYADIDTSIINTVQTKFSAQIKWLDNDDSYATRVAKEENFIQNYVALRVQAYDGSGAKYLNSSLVTYDKETGTFSLQGLPNYDSNRNQLHYSIQVGNITRDDAGNVIAVTDNIERSAAVPSKNGVDGYGGYYLSTYVNDDIHATSMDALYNGGTLTEKLSNTTSFTYNKEWSDGDTKESERPQAKIYMYAISSETVLNSNGSVLDISEASPVNGFGSEKVPTHDACSIDVASGIQLPMYDATGTMLVYFIKETDLGSGYVSDIDNKDADPCQLDEGKKSDIINKFNTLTDESGNVKYILNRGTVDNKKSEPVTVSVQVTLDAVSMQSAEGISVKLQLQKWDRNLQKWVNVDVDIDGEPMPEAELDGFSGNAMTKTATSRWVNKYDDDGYEITYRYIQTDFGFKDEYTSLSYKDSDKKADTYDLNKTVIGRQAAGVDGVNTTAYISGTMEIAGARQTVIYNVIQANTVVESVKKWTDSGEDVTDKLSDEAYAVFRITRNDGKHSIAKDEEPDEDTLRDSEGNIVYDVRLNNSTDWVNYTDNLERFDASGMEYTYLTSETEYSDGGYITEKYGADSGHKWEQIIKFSQCVTDPTDNHTVITSNDQDCGQADKTLVGEVTNELRGPGDSIRIAFMKNWQDGGDLLSRRSCIFAVYKIENTEKENTPQLLEVVTLSESDNWYHDQTYDKGMACLDGSTLTEVGTQDDYVVVEVGTADHDGGNITYNYYNSKKYDELSIDDLRSIKASQDGTTSVGTVASDETDPVGYSAYTYNVTSEYGKIVSDIPGYIITNTRVADVGMDMSKTWADGGKRRTSRFVLYRYNSTDIKYEDPTTIWEFSLPAEGSGNSADLGLSDNFSYEYKEEDKTSSVSIRGLDKYDAEGNAYIYRIVETGIVDKKTGKVIPIENGQAIVSGDRYVCNTADVSEEYGKLHNSHDLFTKESTNTLSDTTEISLNKVWYDNGLSDTLEHRPSIYFKVYRMSANYDVEYGGETINLAEYIESDNFSASTFSEIFNAAVGAMDPEKFAEKVADIKDDRMWDASANVFYWSCDLNELPKFNEEGERYIYFAVEGGIENSLYTAFYGNMTSEELYPDASVQNPSSGKEIYDIYSVDSYESCADDTVLIINDGYHGSDYYSRTVVNKISNSRMISGRKLWKIPSSLQLPDSQMPEVKMQLYKTVSPITDDWGIKYNYTNDDIDAAVESGTMTWVADFKLHTSEAGAFNFTTYTYSIANEQNADGTVGEKLQRYDEYGMPYYYYIREVSEYDGYDRKDTTYSLLDLSAVNNYTPEQSKVQISVSKTWNKWPVSKDDELVGTEAEKRDAYYDNINVKDLEPIEFTLTAYLEEDRDNTEIELGTVTLSPKDPTGVTNEDGSVTVSYTFKSCTDGSDIPYYAANGKPYKFAVTEKCPDGYEVTPSSGTIDVELHLHEVTTSHGVTSKTYTNFGQEVNEAGEVISEDVDKIAKFTNVYTGEETEFTVYKKWNDGYVDNSRFRPYCVIFTVYRYTINENNEKVQDPNFLRWYTVTKSTEWKATRTKLEKYDINGNLFHYYIGKEELRLEDGSQWGTAEQIGDTVRLGNVTYKLTEKTENSFTNELVDKTSVLFVKDWKIGNDDSKKINWPIFEKLRSMNVLPASAAYIVQRSTNGSDWEYVTASSEGSAQYKVTDQGQWVVGCEIDITKITPATFDQQFYFATKFDNLPKIDENGSAYTYRVIERLKWAGDENYYYYYTTDTTQRGTQFTIQADSSGSEIKYTACNAVSVSKGRVAKYWKDDNDFDNTRPESIKITISQNSAAGDLSFVVNVNATGSKYLSEEFYIVDENIINPMDQNADGTLKNYTVTEEYTYSDGRTDLYIHDGKDVSVTKDPVSGAYIFSIDNNYSGRKLVKIEATKNWIEPGTLEAYKKWQTETTRPLLIFTLQYKDPATNTWMTMSDAALRKFTDDSSLTASQLIDPTEQGGTSATVSWDKLYKYWKSGQLGSNVPAIKDGEPQIIEYRVVGKFVKKNGSVKDLSYYDYVSSKSDSDFFDIIDYGSFTESKNTYSGSVTNTQNGYSLSVTKKFVSGDKHELTWDEVSLLQKLNALPVAIDVQIEYAIGNSSTYAPLPFFEGEDTSVYRLEINKNTYNKAIDISGSSRLIKYDKNGELINYRVSEVAVYYANNEKVSLGQNTAVIGNFKVTQPAVINLEKAENKTAVITNEYASGSIAVNKIWKDEGNRDALAGDIKLKLTGLSQDKSVELTLNKNNNWSDSTSWKYIPVKDHTGTSDVTYTVDEISINGRAVSAKTQEGTTVITDGNYIVTYSDGRSAVNSGTLTDGGTLSIAVTNTYIPARGSIDAAKIWIDDSDWKDVIRPESVEVSLEYKTTGNWTQVSQNTLGRDGLYTVDADHPEGGIYTTSNPSQTLTADKTTGKWNAASWDNLPVNYNNNGTSRKVMYRVVETTVSGYTTAYTYTLNDDGTPQEVPDSGVSFNKDGDAVHVTVSNTAELGTLSVYKTWHNNAITGKNISSDILSTLIDAGLLPKTLYMSVEYSATPEDDTSWKTIPVELETGKEDGWFSFDTISDYNGKENVVSNLPKFSNDASRSPIYYRVVEMGADYKYQDTVNYKPRAGSVIGNIVVSGDDNKAFAWAQSIRADIVNSYESVSVKALKNWRDEKNRDALRSAINVTLNVSSDAVTARTISTAQLNYDATITRTEVPTGESGLTNYGWGYTWSNLPSKDFNGRRLLYSLKESGISSEYTVRYMPERQAGDGGDVLYLNIENSHVPNRGIITANKIWTGDQKGLFGSRDTIKAALQYSLDNGNTWEFVTGNVEIHRGFYNGDAEAYTTSALVQTIYDAATGTSYTAKWEKVPVNYNNDENVGTKTQILYRVVEVTGDEETGYTVIETGTELGGYTAHASSNIKLTNDTESKGDVENELKTTGLTIEKTWTDDDLIYSADGTKAVSELTRPQSITFKVEYKIGSGEWRDLPATSEGADYGTAVAVGGLVTVTGSQADTTWTASLSGLPAMDMLENEYSYRVSESSLTYADGTKVNVTGTFDADTNIIWTSDSVGAYTGKVTITKDEAGAFKASAENTLIVDELTVTKVWNDGQNRDGVRPESIVVKLYKNDTVVDERTFTAQDLVEGTTDQWSYTWKNLPVYGSNGSKNVYKVVEVLTDADTEYETTTYVPAETTLDTTADDKIVITNEAEAKKVTFKTSKNWKDNENHYGLRPASVEFTLQYSLDEGTTWIDADAEDSIVEKVAELPAPGVDTGTVIYTTSELTQTVISKETEELSDPVSWNDLSAYVLIDGVSTKVYYRAYEKDSAVPEGYSQTLPTQAVAYDESQAVDKTYDAGQSDGFNVVNTLDLTYLEVTKTWLPEGVEEFKAVNMPVYITVRAQYSADDGKTWTDIKGEAGSAKLTKEGGWSYTFTDLPDNYTYRAVEESVTWIIDGAEKTIAVAYASADDKTAGTVGGFDYTSETTVVTAPAVEGEGSATGVTAQNGYKTTITNELIVDELTITKVWNDGQNRDGVRPESILVKLYKNDTVVDERTFTAQDLVEGTTDQWSYTWKNLPVYGSNGSKNVYKVVEVLTDADTEYETTTYVPAETTLDTTADDKIVITNEAEAKKVTFKTSKNWKDNENHYGLRPASVEFTLQYSLDEGTTWIDADAEDSIVEKVAELPAPGVDTGTVIYTTSELTQTVISKETEELSDPVSWNDLSAYVLIDGVSTKVYYRAYEKDSAVPEGYSQTLPTQAVSYDESLAVDKIYDAGQSEGYDVVNTLNPTYLEVTKNWLPEGVEDIKTVDMPAYITVRAQYSADNGKTWTDIQGEVGSAKLTKEGGWSYTFTDLPDNYTYRAVEESVTWIIDGAEKTIAVAYASADDKTAGTVGGFDYTSETAVVTASAAEGEGLAAGVTAQNGYKTTIINTMAMGCLNVIKTWDDGNDRDGIRPQTITLTLYRIDTADGKSKTEALETVTIAAAEDGSMSYTWNDLPVYSTYSKSYSEYYVVEEDISGEYKAYYRADVSKTEGEEDPIAAKIQLSDAEQSIINIINSHDIKTFTINADKLWNDYNNKYQKRDSSVTFTLEYSLDNGKTWNKAVQKSAEDRRSDDGKSVWTSSKVSQVLTGDASADVWSGASWKDITAYALDSNGKSVEVLYRVTETATGNNCYTIIAGDTVSYSKAGSTQTVKVTIENRMTTIPKTGDESNAGMWMMIMGAALAAVLGSGVTLRVNRKRQYKK